MVTAVVKDEAQYPSELTLPRRASEINYFELSDGKGAVFQAGPEEAIAVVHDDRGQESFVLHVYGEVSPFLQRLRTSHNSAKSAELIRICESEAAALGLKTKLFSPSLSISGLSSADLLSLNGLVAVGDPNLVRDSLTKFPTKAKLLSQNALDAVSAKLVGPKQLLFMDFNHMGVADRFLLSNELEAVLGSMGALARQAFVDQRCEIYRVGGDEFVLLTQDKGEPTREAFKKFVNLMRAQRESCFNSDDPRVQAAEKFAEFRDARRHRNSTEPRIMTFTTAAVSLGEALTPEIVMAALAQSGTEIHLIKKGLKQVDLANPEPLTTEVRRTADRLLIDSVRDHEAARKIEIDKLKTEELDLALPASFVFRAMRLANINCADPAVDHGVMRLGVLYGSAISGYLPITSESTLSVVDLDVAGFSIINSELGYERADFIVRELASKIRRQFPSGLLVRSNGGRITVWAEQRPSNKDLLDLKEQAERFLDYAVVLPGLTEKFKARQELALVHLEFMRGLATNLEAIGSEYFPECRRRIAVLEQRHGSDYQERAIRLEVRVGSAAVNPRTTFGELYESLDRLGLISISRSESDSRSSSANV